MTIEQQCFCCGKDFHEGAAQIMVDVDQDNGDVIVCVPCFVTHCCGGKWIDAHSVNCYCCGELVDERECLPADAFNNDDGGDICPACQSIIQQETANAIQS